MDKAELLHVQEFPDAADADPDWQAICAIFRQLNQHAEPLRSLTMQGLEKIAALYEREEARWGEFLAEHGIEGPRRGPKPKSRFHGIIKYLLGLGAHGDETGTASVLAANLDAWLENRETIRPVQIPEWIAATAGGVRAIYEARKDGGPAPDARSRREHNDIVYTSRELARRIVDHFRPHFRPGDTFLDICAGDNAFYDALPEPKDWCEIQRGRDFLDWKTPATWGMTNPAWSAEAYRPIARHAYELCENIVFLARWHTATATYARHHDWINAGHGWRETIYIPWADAKFIDKHGDEKAEGFILAAFWWQRGWTGGMQETYWTNEGRKLAKCFNVRNIVGKKSNNDECYTPQYIFNPLGCRFDLDPASPGKDVVLCVVPADHIYTKSDDGLTKPWWGFVWLNPPYGRDILKKWTARFAEHGNGVILVKDQTSTRWYRELSARADLILSLNKKIPFIRPGVEKPRAFPIGHHLIAIGERGVAALENAHRAGLGKLLIPHRNAEARRIAPFVAESEAAD